MPHTTHSPILLTAKQVSALIQIPVSTVYEYARRKHNPLPSIRIGKHVRFRLDDILGWLDEPGVAA